MQRDQNNPNKYKNNLIECQITENKRPLLIDSVNCTRQYGCTEVITWEIQNFKILEVEGDGRERIWVAKMVVSEFDNFIDLETIVSHWNHGWIYKIINFHIGREWNPKWKDMSQDLVSLRLYNI